jgi:rRNA biogenesis protein RRP5
MSAIKRKNGPSNESFVRSRRTTEIDGPPSKRPRKEGSVVQTGKNDRDAKPITSVSLQVTKIAGTKGEEPAFPRGGASILTPLEYKQIQNEATRDVLFEQQGISRKQETQDEESVEPMVSKKTAKKRKFKLKGQEMTQKQDVEDESVKIEGLSYKVCTVFCE